MADRLVWETDGKDWPNRAASRFVTVDGLTWHVQQMGSGPHLLLLHGTGASTHSFAELARLLARDFTITMPDLPGHGFTSMPPSEGLSLPGMARHVGGLMTAMGVAPVLACGHSAGAAILIRMGLDRLIQPKAIISINGALRGFRGFAGKIFSPLANMLVMNPVVSRLVTWRAGNRAAVERLLEGTGSQTHPEMVDLYWRLFRSPQHVAGALGMMANWDLPALERAFPDVRIPMLLVAAMGDRAVPAEDAAKVRDAVHNAPVEVAYLEGVGHLAHEEAPERIAELIRRSARTAGVLG